MMRGNRKKLRLLGAFAALLSLALAVGCKGFFQNPTLTTITVGPPTPSIAQGTSLQMSATGTYNDGSMNTLTSGVFWSSSDSTIASISSSGVMKGQSVGSATITASVGAISGTTSVTITLANLVSIAITPTSPTILEGQTQQFVAEGTVSGGGTTTITDSVTWNSSNTNAGTIDSTGLFTAVTAVTGSVQTTITATSGNITSNAATLTVNQ
jgi:trimeric autotransporter adhesin